jgi:hypothetical protein
MGQILCFWALSIALSSYKNSLLFILQNNVSKTEFCLRLQVKTIQLGPMDRARPYLRTENKAKE